jgi:D-alanyl-D-alanine dipeptidase
MILKKYYLIFVCIFLLSFSPCIHANVMPPDFVHLNDIDPTIIQDMRYATTHNFVGHPIPGYQAATCILTHQAAVQLKKIQTTLNPLGYSLKVYDCYRPTEAVDAFAAWSQNKSDLTKTEFYPNIDKKNLYELGYVAFEKSSHSRGSTVDLTIVKLPKQTQEKYIPHQHLRACYASYSQRFHDNSIDMGTGYDCFSPLSHPDNVNIPLKPFLNRMFLRYWMEKHEFAPLETEWWHFTLTNEPYPDTYFNFPVQ